MSLTLEILRKSVPSQPGYGDRGRLYDGSSVVWEKDNKVSGGPNPVNPHTNAPWDTCYACICCGVYQGTVINDTINGHGLCIVLDGKPPTILPNSNHGGAYYAENVLVHKGDSLEWRGSAACITISPDVYDSLFALLPVGTVLNVAVIHNGK